MISRSKIGYADIQRFFSWRCTELKAAVIVSASSLQRIARLWRVNQVRFNFSAIATRRRSASEREGLSGWRLVHASTSAVNADGGGRPASRLTSDQRS